MSLISDSHHVSEPRYRTEIPPNVELGHARIELIYLLRVTL